METAMKIRHQILVGEKSIRSISKETGISRNTIKKYLTTAETPTYKRIESPHLHKLHPYKQRLSEWFTQDLLRAKRERRTAHKLHEQLVIDGYRGSYDSVRRYIKDLKNTHISNQAFVPLSFQPGDAMQFDWSQEVVVLGGIEQTIKVAHFKLAYSRKPFVIAYPNEKQEMLLDAFIQAFEFYQFIPKRVLIDNPKTMVTTIGRGKERTFHPIFLALMNHYIIEPVACTPAAGWEKGQIENQVGKLRGNFFTPKLHFDTLADLNIHLHACSLFILEKNHPNLKEQTIGDCFIKEQASLRPSMKPFDGYIEKTIGVSSTCLAQYDTNYYSVPCEYASKGISLKIYANRIQAVVNNVVIAEHQRCFNRYQYIFNFWHYLPLLERKPGALRNGAPFENLPLPKIFNQLKTHYLKQKGGDKDFVKILMLIKQHGIDPVTCACELAIEEKTYQLSAIINMLNRLTEELVTAKVSVEQYPVIICLPLPNCARYDQLGGVAI